MECFCFGIGLPEVRGVERGTDGPPAGELGEEVFGLEILKVQEIIKMQDVTKLPLTPHFVRGLINLRGAVIPVVDLRLKFGMEQKEATERTCIIVVQVARRDTRVTMGIVVDEVSEVLDIAGGEIEQTPSMGSEIDTRFILGIAKTKVGVSILLDVDKVLSAEEVVAVSAAAM